MNRLLTPQDEKALELGRNLLNPPKTKRDLSRAEEVLRAIIPYLEGVSDTVGRHARSNNLTDGAENLEGAAITIEEEGIPLLEMFFAQEEMVSSRENILCEMADTRIKMEKEGA